MPYTTAERSVWITRLTGPLLSEAEGRKKYPPQKGDYAAGGHLAGTP